MKGQLKILVNWLYLNLIFYLWILSVDEEKAKKNWYVQERELGRVDLFENHSSCNNSFVHDWRIFEFTLFKRNWTFTFMNPHVG